MAWTHHVDPDDSGVGTYHFDDADVHGSHLLRVYHLPDRFSETHQVTLHSPAGTTQFTFPSYSRPDGAFLHTSRGVSHYAPPPSEALKSLIEQHHHTGAWMPLLDQLVTEYPHLEPDIARHIAARYSGA